jgi:hypothetical protein
VRLINLLLFFCISAPAILFGQSLELTIPNEELPSDIATWQSEPGLMHISFSSPENIRFDDAHIVFEVTEGNEHILVSSRSKFSEQPALNGSFKKKTFKFEDIVDSGIVVDPALKSPSSSIGRLPGGLFTLCIYLVDSAGKQIGSVAQGCSSFGVRDIDSPELLKPANESTLDFKAPLAFSWTPANILSQTAHYKLKIYPIYEGQTPAQAMASTSAFYASDDIFSTTFDYPPDAPRLTEFPKAKGFTWVVTQMDQNGKAIGKNYGRSVPSVFYRPVEGK